MPAYLLNATLLGVLAQRLVRTLCPACKQPDETFASAALEDAVKPWKLGALGKSFTPYKPVGCLECRMSGYRGRLGLYELLTVDETVREEVNEKISLVRLRKAAIGAGMRPLRLGGAQRIADGSTTLDEVLLSTPNPVL